MFIMDRVLPYLAGPQVKDKMSRPRTILFAAALMLIVSLLMGCGASSEEPVGRAAAPAATSESSASGDPSAADELEKRPDSPGEVPRMTADDLKERLDDGQEIVIVDTRSEAAYEAKHIAGAIWVSPTAVDSPLDDLPLDQEIVLYCT